MKNSRILWLIFAILIISFLVILCSSKIANIEQHNSKRDTRQNQSETDDQVGLTTSFENITHSKVCVAQWREELITTEEALRCIDSHI